MDKIIVVTPAGRRRYLELLAHYVLSDKSVSEWQLWDNCRDPSDRHYIQKLGSSNSKIRIIALQNSIGDNRSINKFYREMTDPDAFYVKIDDDLVYIEPGFFGRFLAKAQQLRDRAIWFSPIVLNNAICTWLLAYHKRISVAQPISCLASCDTGWRSAEFSVLLHNLFLSVLKSGEVDKLRVPDIGLTTGRFSINCLGIFGSERIALGDNFCPLNADDEEYISAVLPLKTGKQGFIIGSEVVSHFSFFTQEHLLLKTDILGQYYSLAGLEAPKFTMARPPLKKLLLRALDDYRYRLGNKTAPQLM